MGQDKIKELFFENPSKGFYLRQVAKMAKTPKTTTERALKQLVKVKLIKKTKSEPYSLYQANAENPDYVFYKKQYLLEKIHNSKIVDNIVEKAQPNVIILFGSCANGTFTEKSDIDLFVQAESVNLDLNKNIDHNVHLYFEENLKKLSSELLNNVVNGIILYGRLKL